MMSTRGSCVRPATSNSDFVVWRRSICSNQAILPVCTRPTGPRFGLLNVSTLVVSVLVTLRAAWISSLSTTSTPRPLAPGLAATATAL